MKIKRGLPVTFLCLFGIIPTAEVFAQMPTLEYDYHLPGLPEERNRFRSVRYRPAPKMGPHTEAPVITKGPLAPAKLDRISYANFLSQPQTGLVRLLSRFDNSRSGNQPKINGGGAYYSFFNRTHEYGYGSDLELSSIRNLNGARELPRTYSFSVGFAGADYGMLTNLGDVSLESLTVAHPRVEFMLSYAAPRAEPDARCEYRRFEKGVTIDGQLYQSILPVQVGSTYVLRSIVYGRSDVLVGFQVVRQDEDRSVTIAWKLLKAFPSRKLENVLYVNRTDKCPTR